MNLPIFDITNIPFGYLCIVDKSNSSKIDLDNVTNEDIKCSEARKQIHSLFKLNNKLSKDYNDAIYFVYSCCDYDHINKIYKQFYDGDYTSCDYFSMVYLVMQHNIPMQIFIPENRFTFLNEFNHLVLTISNIERLNNKIINFSFYHNKDGKASKELVMRIDECKLLHFIRWSFNDMFIMDIVNEIVKNMYCILCSKHIEAHNNIIHDFWFKPNSYYGFERKIFNIV